MRTDRIQNLALKLNASTCCEAIGQPNLHARRSFQMPSAKVSCEDAMLELCREYYAHHSQMLLAKKSSAPFINGLIMAILKRYYPGGYPAAIDAAVDGTQGDMSAVLDAIKHHFDDFVGEYYYHYIVSKIASEFDYQERQKWEKQIYNV